MKIAFYLPDLQLGGAERMIVNLANNFSSRHFDVDLVVNRFKGHYCDDVSPLVNIVELKVSNSRYAIIGLIKYIKNNKPDRLLSTLFHANIVSILACLFTHSRSICFIRQENVTKEILKNNTLAGKLYYLLTKLLYPLAQGFIGISKGVVDDFVNRGIVSKNRAFIVHNPAITNDIKFLMKEPLNHPWLNEGYYTFINVGRFNVAKNQDMLIRSFKHVNREVSNTRLILVGDGELRGELINLTNNLGLNNCIDFVGRKKNPYSWMYNADCFTFSSNWEGFGNVLVEALYCCGNVISTDCPSGPSEILDNGKYGILVPVGDEQKLAEAMILKSNEKNNYRFDGNESLCYMRFHIDTISNKYLEVLQVNSENSNELIY